MDKSQIIERLKTIDATPLKELGQNFLVDGGAIEKIMTALSENLSDELLEIGPGLGSLTEEILKLDQPLTLIEFDKKYAEFWRNSENKNIINVYQEDALKVNWPKIMSANYTLVSNLPYQIASHIIIERTRDAKPPKAMVLMFQREVADRIQGNPNSKAYGLISIFSQLYWSIESVVKLGPGSFYPKPKVNSEVLLFKPKINEVAKISDEDLAAEKKGMLRLVKAAFSQRRKMAFKNISGHYPDVTKENLEEAFKQLGLSLKFRAENISPENFKLLFYKLKAYMKK